jgi:hypothetical protein
MLDENLNLWFIECNASPVFQGTTSEKLIFQTTLLRDAWEIENSYLQSRVKRLNKFTIDLKKVNQTVFTQDEWDKMRTDLVKINRNYIDEEFKIKKKNSFTKIIDFSLNGPERFFDLFPKKCFTNI